MRGHRRRLQAKTGLRLERLEPRCLFNGDPALDYVVFGNAQSEAAHSFSSYQTQVVTGALGQPARKALPLAPVDIYGGTLTFTLQVDPVERNYVTLKLWGGDDVSADIGRLYLYASMNGVDYQIGYRHEGDYANLNAAADEPPLPGRFFYTTTLLPLWMTQGASSVTLKVVSAGRLYSLGSGVESAGGNYQFLMDTPSRSVYAAYSHLDPLLDVSGEVQGAAPTVTTNNVVANLIDATTNNGSFELLGGQLGKTAKATHWDTDTDGNVDSWTLWSSQSTAANDSGTEYVPTRATDGNRLGFLQPGNAVYNRTSHAIQAGQTYSLLVDHANNGARGAALAGLGYWNGTDVVGIPGMDMIVGAEAGGGAGTYSRVVTMPAGPWVGASLAFTLRDVVGGATYPEIDNVRLVVGTLVPTVTEADVLGPAGSFTTGMASNVASLLATAPSSLGTENVEFLAKAYGVASLANAYLNPQIVTQVVAAIDAYATSYFAAPTAVSAGGNEAWGGRFGYLGGAIHRLLPQLQPYLNSVVNFGPGGNRIRRDAWGDMLLASRDYGRSTRDSRTITNQTLWSNYAIYKANLALLDLNHAGAMAEHEAHRYLCEAIGLEPWRGSDLPNGSSSLRFGDSYFQVTEAGLSREWGYVGLNYGEVQFFATEFYRLTGNTAFKDQALKMALARAPFRRPSVEQNGAYYLRKMEGIGLLAWRGAAESDSQFTTSAAYADRDGFGMSSAAVTLDPTLVGYAKQMLGDDQYFRNLEPSQSIFALDVFADYATVKTAPDSGARLPMTTGQPDFVWADEDSGIVAVKRGEERLWVESFWQVTEGNGLNGLGRFYFSTSTHDQYGMFETAPSFSASGDVFVRANRIDGPKNDAYLPPNPPLQAYAGERLPLTTAPETAWDGTPYRGRADYDAFRLGSYVVGINRTEGRTYELSSMAAGAAAAALPSGQPQAGSVPVPPRSTVVLSLTSAWGADVPFAPLYVDASTIAGGNMIAWNAASGATSYTIERGIFPDGPFVVLATNVIGTPQGPAGSMDASYLSYVDSTAVAATTYFYRVKSVGPGGESAPSTAAGVGLPGPWMATDIGQVQTAGRSSYDAVEAQFSVRGAGSNIGGTADSFHFAHVSAAGATQISARVIPTAYAGGAKAGLMVREQVGGPTAAGARMVALYFDEALDQVVMASRTATNANTSFAFGPAHQSRPVWLRLSRSGASVVGSYSTDGATWTVLATTTIVLNNSVYWGLANSSRIADAARSALFEEVAAPGWTPLAATPGDFDNDGRISGGDFLVWQRELGSSGAPLLADDNGDGVVNGQDLTVWRAAFGSPLPGAFPVFSPVVTALSQPLLSAAVRAGEDEAVAGASWLPLLAQPPGGRTPGGREDAARSRQINAARGRALDAAFSAYVPVEARVGERGPGGTATHPGLAAKRTDREGRSAGLALAPWASPFRSLRDDEPTAGGDGS